MKQVVVYQRVSTDKQEMAQQANTVNAYLAVKGLTPTKIVEDEGVSGGVTYAKRKLGKVVSTLQRGDVLVVSEISRLGRSISDITKLVNEELAPRGVRLCIASMNVDMDTANLQAMDQMFLFAFSFAAQIEKELIQARTQSAIDVRQAAIKDNGGFVAKRSGRYVTKLGNPNLAGATKAAAEAKRTKALSSANNQAIWEVLLEANGGRADKGPSEEALKSAVCIFAEREIKSQTGKPISIARARASWYKLKPLFT